jgi:hypothetical protein
MGFGARMSEKILASQRYGLNCPIAEIPLKELRNMKFGLSFRWYQHLKNDHKLAAESAKCLLNVLRREIFERESKGEN